ncbi:hypothetical protein CRUP_010239 [Coryphaenoides rupestris]|nr:hypothetical protein CRUP_010239 [Coryphaenoides rupestris]
METRGIEDMFDFRRFPKDGLLLLLVLLYAPVGVCLMLLRIFIGVHVFLVSCALPESFVRRFIVRIMCSVLGMHVRQNNPRSRDANTKLYICNHVTEFDHNIINLLTPCSTPQAGGSTGFVCWARGFMEMHSAQGAGSPRRALQRYCSYRRHPSPAPLPRRGHHQRARRPPQVQSMPDSSWLLELFWLPPVSRQDRESVQEFANKIQELLASELGVVSTQVTKADKAEHIKRNRHRAPQTSTGVGPGSIARGFMAPSLGTEEPRIIRMSQQVKDVLPHVPLNVIARDLVKTNCVDTTITNLLELSEDPAMEASASGGAASFGPSRNSSSFSYEPIPTAKPVAKSFGKSPTDRHMSLQERKDALYNYARRRYIEKHGLDREDCQ